MKTLVLLISFFLIGNLSYSQDSLSTSVSIPAEYPGGNSELFTYLSTNISYPDSAKKHGIEGKVYVKFTVQEDGSISNVKILRGIGYGCDEEVIRVFQSMPRWKPAEENGIKIASQLTFPMKFMLD